MLALEQLLILVAVFDKAATGIDHLWTTTAAGIRFLSHGPLQSHIAGIGYVQETRAVTLLLAGTWLGAGTNQASEFILTGIFGPAAYPVV